MENRIIGDFIEINGYIVQQQFESKLPKFLSSLRAKIQRRRLLKRVEKIRRSGIILNADRIIELFTYICNTFYPDSKFGHVTKCVVRENISEAIIEIDGQITAIVLDQTQYPKFNVISKIKSNDETYVGINIDTELLYSDNIKKNKFLQSINKVLLEDICDFIVYSIKPYQNTNSINVEENNDDGKTTEIIQVETADVKYDQNWSRIGSDDEASTNQTDNS